MRETELKVGRSIVDYATHLSLLPLMAEEHWCATQACYLTLPAPFLLSEKLNIPPFIRNYTQKGQNISMSNISISDDLTFTRQTYYGDDKRESSLFPTSDNSLIMLFPQVERMCLDTAIWSKRAEGDISECELGLIGKAQATS